MVSALTPHHIVALLLKLVGVNHNHGPSYADLNGCALIGSMLEDNEGNTGTFLTIDAFVNICVSDLQYQVVAIALPCHFQISKALAKRISSHAEHSELIPAASCAS